MRIIISLHKEYPVPTDPLYLPLQVGADLTNTDLGFEKDNTGDHISFLNRGFCELTALYWAWKNLEDEVLGFVHYRRYFALRKEGPWQERVLRFEELIPLVKRYPVLVPKKRRYFIETLYSHYAHTHKAEELDAARDLLAAKKPEYIEDFDAVVKMRSGYMFNMMILRRDLLNEYCDFLFPILFGLTEKLGERDLTPYEMRFTGRVSEILFNVWLRHALRTKRVEEGRVYELPMITTERTNWIRKGGAFLRAKFFGKKYTGSF